MRENRITCDICGRSLPQHGNRYTVDFTKIPVRRLAKSEKPYDLCPQCAARLKVQLGRRDGYMEVRTDG